MNLTQRTTLAVLPKIFGIASMILSSCIVFLVLCDKNNRKKTYHRLLCGLSSVDMSSSLWFALTTWPMPKDSGALWAAGTTATCSLQGYFTQFAVAGALYNGSLSIYYVLVICYNWSDAKMARIEPVLHGLPLLWGFGTATVGVFLELYNDANLWCWIAPLPSNCETFSNIPCQRGKHAAAYRWALFYGPIWLAIAIVSINLILVYRHVQRVEKASEKYAFRRQSNDCNSSGSLEGPKSDDTSIDYSSFLKSDLFGFGSVEGVDSEEFSSDREIAQRGDGLILSSQPVSGPSQYEKKRLNRTRSRLTQNLKKRREASLRRAKEVAAQSFYYAGSFYCTWLAVTIVRLVQTINGKSYFWLLAVAAITTPMQGLPNFIVYLYPKFNQIRKERPTEYCWRWIRYSLTPR